MRSLYKGIYWVFMAAVLVLGGLLIVSLVPISGVKVKIVKSGSMEPAIKTGSIVVDMPATSYRVGDVITFGPDTKTQIPTSHRVVAIAGPPAQAGEGASAIYTTKGDANDAPDPVSTRLSDIHGKVLFTVPYLGYVLDFARRPLGFALLVGLPALAIILEEAGKIVREVRALRRARRRRAEASRSNIAMYASQKYHIRRVVD